MSDRDRRRDDVPLANALDLRHGGPRRRRVRARPLIHQLHFRLALRRTIHRHQRPVDLHAHPVSPAHDLRRDTVNRIRQVERRPRRARNANLVRAVLPALGGDRKRGNTRRQAQVARVGPEAEEERVWLDKQPCGVQVAVVRGRRACVVRVVELARA